MTTTGPATPGRRRRTTRPRRPIGGLEFTVQGASGERHAEPCVADNPMNTTAWLAAPAQQVASVCVAVPLDDLDGAVWRIGQRGAGEDAYVALS